MTISIFRHSYPRNLFRDLKADGSDVVAEAPGVFRVDGLFIIPIRIIVTRMLTEDYAALRLLAKGISEKDVLCFSRKIDALSEKDVIMLKWLNGILIHLLMQLKGIFNHEG